MKEKLLSIIIPSYNMEKYLDRCVSSLIIPSIDKLDILIINDGSKDNTSKIGHYYETLYPNSIKCIDKINGNYGSCINRGLAEACGKYVRVLDADDCYLTSELERFVNSIRELDIDCIVSNYQRVDPKGNIIKRFNFNSFQPMKKMKLEDASDILIQKIEMHGITFKTSIFRELNYFQTEGISYTDCEWIYTPIAQSKSFVFVPFTIYSYTFGREGQTVSPIMMEKHLKDNIVGIEKQTVLLEQKGEYNIEQRSFLIRMLARRIIGLYYQVMFSNKQNKQMLSDLDKNYDTRWKKLGLDISKLVEIPYFHKSFIDDWRNLDYNSNYKLDYYNKIFYLSNKLFHKMLPHMKASYVKMNIKS